MAGRTTECKALGDRTVTCREASPSAATVAELLHLARHTAGVVIR